MIPDVQQMSVPELERLLVMNAAKAREIGGGKVTLADITMAIGISHDDEQVKHLKSRMGMMKCFTHSGKYYTFLVDSIDEPDDDIVKNDPTMSLMNDIFDLAIKPSPERDITLHVTDDSKQYPCKNCIYFNIKNGSCDARDGDKVDGNEVQEDCDEFSIDMGTLGYNKKTWYKKKKQGAPRRK